MIAWNHPGMKRRLRHDGEPGRSIKHCDEMIGPFRYPLALFPKGQRERGERANDIIASNNPFGSCLVGHPGEAILFGGMDGPESKSSRIAGYSPLATNDACAIVTKEFLGRQEFRHAGEKLDLVGKSHWLNRTSR